LTGKDKNLKINESVYYLENAKRLERNSSDTPLSNSTAFKRVCGEKIEAAPIHKNKIGRI